MEGLATLNWKLGKTFELKNETGTIYNIYKIGEYLLPLWKEQKLIKTHLKHVFK